MSCQAFNKEDYCVISFAGDAANWPSKSNDAQITYKHGKPRVSHTKEFHARMAYIKLYYNQATYKPAFGIEPTIAICLLGSNMRMHDSHNFCKTFGDFCEDVGIIDNDRYLTIWPVHKKHCGIIGVNESTLDIILTKCSNFNFNKILEDFRQ